MSRQQMNKELIQARAEIEEIINSRSWRLTKPLRWFGTKARNVVSLVSFINDLRNKEGGILRITRKVFFSLKNSGARNLHSQLVRKFLYFINSGSKSASETPVFAPTPQLRLKKDSYHREPYVLFVSHDASRTGAPIFLLTLIRYLTRFHNIRPEIILRSGGELENEFRKLGSTNVLQHKDIIDSQTLRRYKKSNIRLVYSNTITNGAIQTRLKTLGCPIICHVHELKHSIDNYFGGENLKEVLKSTSLFLAGSRAVKSYLCDELRLPADKVKVVYPFIDIAHNIKHATSLKTKLNIGHDTLIVGGCGVIGWRKGTDLFVQLARNVIEKTNKPVCFIWVGGYAQDNNYRYFEYDASVAKISQAIKFTGFVKEHLPYFACFDIFVLTSREDPFPLVALDAASLKKPIVCFDQSGGITEFVKDGAGIISPYLDLSHMTDAVLSLLRDRSYRQSLGRNAGAKVRELHDISNGGACVAQIINTYISKSEVS
jgi:glycosyltransferase involved in cell wall biosynthesis